MITRKQQILLKRAQADAGLDDAEYRTSVELVSGLPGARSSKDPRLSDGHVDRIMGYFEAVYWRLVDAGEVSKPSGVFRVRGYWAKKNKADSSSRDRWVEERLLAQINQAQQGLIRLGYNEEYFYGIERAIVPFSLFGYAAALNRTLRSKLKQKEANERAA